VSAYRHIRELLIAVPVCLLAGCGNSTPTSPTRGLLDLNGQWRGTYSIMGASATISEPLVSGSISQTGTAVNGSWVNTGDRTGTFSGTLASQAVDDGRVSGTMRIAVPSGTAGTMCTASGAFTGTATASTLVITAPTFVWDNCPTFQASNGVLSMNR
jgi:hypothetical protein